MMPDDFPKKKKGDGLSHQHVNALSDVARTIKDRLESSPHPPWQQHTFKIVSIEGSSIYKGQIRYYSHSGSEWLEKEREWDLDISGLDLSVSINDFLTAYWNDQRSMYIAVC